MGIHGEIAVLDATGDTKTTWDTDNDVEVEAARTLFDTLRKKSYLIYRSTRKGEKGEAMNKFDPEAGMMIAVPPIVGG